MESFTALKAKQIIPLCVRFHDNFAILLENTSEGILSKEEKISRYQGFSDVYKELCDLLDNYLRTAIGSILRNALTLSSIVEGLYNGSDYESKTLLKKDFMYFFGLFGQPINLESN